MQKHTDEVIPYYAKGIISLNFNNGICDECYREYLAYLTDISMIDKFREFVVIQNIPEADRSTLIRSGFKKENIYRSSFFYFDFVDPFTGLSFVKIGDKQTIDTIMLLLPAIQEKLLLIDSLYLSAD